ncbi:MAG: DUF4430 domain-containing protein [Acholeplasmatales bacterium]|nr:DUF4430 domain-containing protein [Acholeplasmatales bacterium]
MKKKLFGCAILLGLGLALTSCSSNEEPKGSYTVKVYDFDGSMVGEKVLDINKYPTLESGLKENFSVKSTGEGENLFITSINNTMVDNNWYLAFYENNTMASVGVGSAVVDDGDVFEFKNECWNTTESGYGAFDSYDVLVDKVVYSYAKNKLQDKLKAYDSIGAIPYELLGIYMMQSNNYDENFFNTNGLADAYKTAITSTDVTTLTGASFAKWYFGARMINTNLDAFKTAYTNYLDSVTAYNEWDEFTLPFTLTFAKGLNLESHVSSNVINTEYLAGTSMGPDGLSWQITGLAEYKTIEEYVLRNNLTKAALDNSFIEAGKGVSLGIMLMAYAACNYNVRTADFADSKDVLEYLFDNYYDDQNNKFSIEGEGDVSSNQLYAALMAYKIQRDQKKAVNIFA